MSRVDDRLVELGQAAVDIANIKNREKRHEGGWWLQGELASLYENESPTEEQKVGIFAVAKVLTDIIFIDAVEGDFVAPGPETSKLTLPPSIRH